jgi:serine/threonine-protein kinase HipA
MTIRTLNASANGRRVGTITDENGVWSFTYDANWLSADNAFPLSPALPLSAERVIDGSTLRPVQWLFDNLLPEEGMRTALAREAKVDASDAWGLLAHFGRESAGALTLLPDGEHESAGGRVPLSLDQLEARIQAMPQHALTATSPKRMSAAGAQQKLLLVLEGHHPEYLLFEPEGTEPSMHLLKPDMRVTGYPHSAINEFFCMRLAREMGLPVPDTHFIRVPSACYVVDRFDRDTSSSPATRRHTIDAMQLLNMDKSFKYREATAQSLEACVAKVSAKAIARLAIFRWTVFNILIGNGDAHLKNLSFFSTARGYQLAPFYDLLSTVVYNTPTYNESRERWPGCELTMPIGNARYFGDITRSNMLAFAEQLGVPRSGAQKDLDRFLSGLNAKVDKVRAQVNQITDPLAGEIRLLDSIARMPVVEMSRALA